MIFKAAQAAFFAVSFVPAGVIKVPIFTEKPLTHEGNNLSIYI
jgi:hypothetical protein